MWIKPFPLNGVVTTEMQLVVTYAKGQLTGNISTGPVTFGEYSIPKQAFISATSYDKLDDFQGVLGLGFDLLSNINDKVVKRNSSDTWGRTVLTNLFDANPKISKSMSFLLGRATDLDPIAKGSFAIGGHHLDLAVYFVNLFHRGDRE